MRYAPNRPGSTLANHRVGGPERCWSRNLLFSKIPSPPPISPRFPDVSRFRVLVADDQPDILLALRLLLAQNGYQVETVNSPQTVLEALAYRTFDVVLMDLNYARDTTSGREGMDLLDRLAHLENLPPIVAMTAWATLDLAIEGLRRGVRDFVLKPWDNRELLGNS